VQFVPAAEDGGRDREPILVDLEVLLQLTGEGHGRLDPPAWPGDALTVAPAGSVLVEGWVERPGSYPVTRALTVAGAVAAAGGRAFPADGHQVKVTRNVGRAEGRSFVVDLEAVASGVAADVPVLDGDVVRLPAAPLRLIPYGAWILAKSMVHVGGSVPLF
jgi:protein involved in polysaccharide export with SLBB domain